MKKLITFLTAAALCLTIFMQSAFAVERYEVLVPGDEDSYVTELQQALNDKGYLTQKPTGYYGTATQSAVIAFQKDVGLTADGKAGPVTRKALLGSSYTEITGDRTTSGTTDIDAFGLGDSGDTVTQIQTLLKKLEYYEYENITGYFGPVTQDAVKRFQSVNGLTADGVVGKGTYALLCSSDAKYYVIYPGDSGDTVVALQTRLKELKYFSGTCTGYYGTVTQSAVNAFQAANGLTVDGKVGKNTREKLNSSSAAVNIGTTVTEVKATVQTSPVTEMISIAKAQLNKPYVWGAEGPDSFDCSGLLYYVLRSVDVSIIRDTAASYSLVDKWDKITSVSDLKAGDLVFFKSDSSSAVSHCGICIGNNQVLHASSGSEKVIISDLTGYYARNFVCGRRVF